MYGFSLSRTMAMEGYDSMFLNQHASMFIGRKLLSIENSDAWNISSYGEDYTNSTHHGIYNNSYINNVTGDVNESGPGYRLHMLLSEPHHLIALLLSLIAIILNLVSLLALGQVNSRVTAHFMFIISLSLSDIITGLSVTMYIMNKVFNTSYMPGVGPWNDRLTSRCMFMFIKSLNSTGLNISLLNLMGMALDHFIAILRPLHYPMIMNKKRVNIMIITLWAIAIIAGFSDYFSGLKWLHRLDEFNYCEITWMTGFHEEFLTLALAFICMIIMTFIYLRIYIKIHRRKQPGVAVRHQQEMKKNRKPLITTFLILGTFLLCWLPLFMYQICLLIIVKVDRDLLRSIQPVLKNADQYLYNLLMLNCIADPIIYTARMKEIKYGYKRLVAKCCGGERTSVAENRYQLNSMRRDSRLTTYTFQTNAKSVYS